MTQAHAAKVIKHVKAASAPDATIPRSQVNVRQFGAKGDGKTDDTTAFQNALNSLGPQGGIVSVPVGNYMIKTHIDIPAHVVLEGVWRMPQSQSQMHGSTLLAVEGAGAETGTAFITLHMNSTLKGMTIYYPNQNPNNIQPYPWCVASAGGDNPTIIDCLMVNPYQAVDFGTHPCGRHFISGLYGQPLRRGIYIDQCYDVGRIENVHFWPFWAYDGGKIQQWMWTNSEAFIFGRSDWQAVTNCFCLGYHIGYHFINSQYGPANGSFVGLGSDVSVNAVVVDYCQDPGLLFTNCEFVAIGGDNPTEVVVNKTNSSPVQFQNCAFWGGGNQIASVAGTGYVSFNNCNFRDWDRNTKGLAAIDVTGGDVSVNGCNFSKASPQMVLEGTAKSATFVANHIAGPLSVTNKDNADLQIGFNTYQH